MKLSDEQEELVRNCVEAQELKLKTLSDDLVDHLCCVIESGLGKEKSFDQLLDNAMAELAPNGLIDLERKTFFLLNFKRIIIIKKVTYSIGFIGTVALLVSFSSQLFGMGFAQEAFGSIGIMLLLIFLPLLIFDMYKVAIAQAMSEPWRIILGTSGVLLTGLGYSARLLHLPFAPELAMLGMTVLIFGFLPFLFFTMYQKSVA